MVPVIVCVFPENDTATFENETPVFGGSTTLTVVILSGSNGFLTV